MNLARSLGSVGGLTLVSRILALVRDTLQASFVGASFASDAFFVAFRLPNMFRALFAEGAFTAPVLARLARDKGIDMPIVEAVDALIAGRANVDRVLDALLTRPPRAEGV